MNRKRVLLKSLDDGRESLAVEVELDHDRRFVMLHMLEFDEGLVLAFLADVLPRDFGVRAHDWLPEQLLALPRYDLSVALAGRHHPVRIQHLLRGRVALRLGDPDADYLGRCRRAIAELLQAVDGLGIRAVVTGVDRYGRPEPNEGFLHLVHDIHDDAQQDELHELCAAVAKTHCVNIIETRFVRPCIDLPYAIHNEPHFAWDAATRQMALRNWEKR